MYFNNAQTVLSLEFRSQFELCSHFIMCRFLWARLQLMSLSLTVAGAVLSYVFVCGCVCVCMCVGVC